MSVLLDALKRHEAEKGTQKNLSAENTRPGENRETMNYEPVLDNSLAQTIGVEAESYDISPAESSEFQTVSKTFEEDAKEPAWSLSNIPGYQAENVTENVKRRQAQNMLQAMQHLKKTSVPSLRWSAAVIFLLVVVVSLGYYGWTYFQMKAQAVHYELAAYQVTPQENLPIPPVSKPVQNTSINTLPSAKSSLSKQSVLSVPVVQTSQIESSAEMGKTVTTSTPSTVTEHLKIEAITQPTDAEKGYQAFLDGQLDQARQFYTSAYHQDSQNMAALFGLAAVAIKQGQKLTALQYYQRILNMAPQNEKAEDAILMLKSQLKGGSSIKELAMRARDFPDNPVLQSALGHHLAKENNWVAAQKHYFNAYQLDSGRDDYALNLAVSLDELGEYSLARQYYERVLQMPSTHLTPERKEQVRHRVNVLRQFLNRKAKSS